MYFKDLTSYSYYLSVSFDEVKNIGWLDKEHDFKQSATPDGFLEKLNAIFLGTSNFSSEVNLIRGFHPCKFCGSNQIVDPKSKMGSCEIWLPGT